jgi:glycosyltransferase involved in cell wall biosynthesis
MKKILFLYQSLEVGGAENLRLALLRNIDKTKFDIKVCSLSNKGLIGEKIERLGYKVDALGQNPDSKSIVITHRLARYLRRERPDILHSCLFNANFHGRIAGLFSRVPFLITEEHSEHFQYNGFKMLPYKIADFILARITDFIVCCSEGLRKDIIRKEKLPAPKVVTIENCIDLERYKIAIEKDEIKKRHNIKDEFVFINVACISVRKGHIFLIESLRDIKDMGYRFKCFFAGDGPLRETLCKKCCELGLSDEIIFLGSVGNIPDYLNASDAFVLPSLFEGLSIALMEAMLMGLPSIVTDVGSNTDLIKTGFNGTVVLPKDREGLKNAIIFYLQNKDLIREYGRRSKSIIETRYSSITAYTRKFHELWDKCVDNKQ